MKKWNKRLILLVILVLVVGVLGGCKKKAPEGMSQGFYDDTIQCAKDLEKIIKNTTKKDIDEDFIFFSESILDFTSKYQNSDLTVSESKAFDKMFEMVAFVDAGVREYFDTGNYFTNEEVEEVAEELSKMLDIEIDADDFIIK